MEKATLGFHIYKIWQILKHFTGTFHQALTFIFRRVSRDALICEFHFDDRYDKISLENNLFAYLYIYDCTVGYKCKKSM